jgi:hypothetical protein
MSDTSTTTAPKPERRYDRPKVPYKDQLKGFRMHDDDRELILDRRHVAFAIPMKEAPDTSTVVGLKLSRPIVVATPYPEIVKWWLGKDAPPTPPAKANRASA